MFYFFMAYLQNVPGQQHNAVALIFYLQNDAPGLKESRFESIWKAPRLIQGMPIKMPIVDLGSTSTLWSPAHAVLKVALNVIAGMQLHSHYGKFVFNGNVPFHHKAHLIHDDPNRLSH